jgi:LysM repeat protein
MGVMIVDFDFKNITDNFKSPIFKVLAIGAGGVGLIVLLSKNKSPVSQDPEEEKRTIIYQNEGGYTTEDIQNYTENLYYSLAEVVGEGIDSLGDTILDAQQSGFSNIQDILNNNSDAGINDNDSETKDPPAPKPKPKPKPSKKYVTVGVWGRDSIYKTTLSGIASSNGISLSKLLSFSENAKYRKNPDLIHPGDKVRVK